MVKKEELDSPANALAIKQTQKAYFPIFYFGFLQSFPITLLLWQTLSVKLVQMATLKRKS
ncbi:hypothetical protein [Neobacillus citreus]|uniref:Uncharacterized protein n=1 Tax=Neobacillus citreus TaxID=2833578 RepID=A0A942T4Q8_9BACI|nr:hypothetical protein [Neobacillus citreus]MCH6264905.1 hypothetical protein [Neobacillus citreus]